MAVFHSNRKNCHSKIILNIIKMRTHYWTCSKFADWIRGTPMPHSETSKGWRVWKKKASESHPIRYWIADTFIEFLEDVVFFIPDKIHDIECYIKNRFVHKTHSLNSKLKPGTYYILETRLFHSIFDELVDFVECEKANSQIVWNNDDGKYKISFWHHVWFVNWFLTYKNAQAGIDHLTWESTLTHNDDWIDKNDPKYGTPTPQAIAAKEILAIYHWYKEVYPKRPDAYDVSGWSKICDERRKKYDDIFLDPDEETPEEKEATKKALDLSNQIEEQYTQEDEDMLIRLIKIRSSLWD